MANLYLDAERLNAWRLGKDDFMDPSDRAHEQEVKALKRAARRSKKAK